MSTHEEYEALITKRYKQPEMADYENYGYYIWVLQAPEQYKTEASMLSYAQKHPNATLKELFDYFNEITPDGLAPGDEGADLMDDISANLRNWRNRKMTVHEEYTKLIEERYAVLQSESYEMQMDYYVAYYAPYQYLTEASMLRYVRTHPQATLKEINDYFNEITPDGLAPGDDGADLMDDDD